MDTHTAPLDANAVIDRMREVVEVQTDIALCASLDLGTSAVSTWRRRNSVPYAECVNLALQHGISLDWLLLGQGPRSPGEAPDPAGADPPHPDPRVARMLGFIRRWQSTREPDEVAWLERTLARNVPEYSQWLAEQATETGRSPPKRRDPPEGETPK